MPPESQKSKQARTAEILERLESWNYVKAWKGKSDPLNELILTILSQSTSDHNRDMAWDNLRKTYPDWQQVIDAGPKKVAVAVRSAGLSNQKGQRIVDVLSWIKETYGELNLDFLYDMDVDEAFETFTKLKGVGLKTMAVVLMFSCGRDVFPVDTHVHRICRRLKLVPDKADAVKTFHLMKPLVPEGKSYSLHMNLLDFGRQICSARSPRCLECPLYDICPWGDKVKKEAAD